MRCKTARAVTMVIIFFYNKPVGVTQQPITCLSEFVSPTTFVRPLQASSRKLGGLILCTTLQLDTYSSTVTKILC